MKRMYLTCKSSHILATFSVNGKDKASAQCRTATDLRAFFDAHEPDVVLSSSTMDFPEEQTTDKDLIALCNKIREAE